MLRDFWLHGQKVCKDAEDTLIWVVTKSSKFIVKSLYNFSKPNLGGSSSKLVFLHGR